MRLTHPLRIALGRMLALGDGRTAAGLGVALVTLRSLERNSLAWSTREAIPVWSLTVAGMDLAEEIANAH